MTLQIDKESYYYRFLKTLNEDVKLTSNEYGEWDIVWDTVNCDWVNVTGHDSLINACIIAIMTRYLEEAFMPPYEEFGCRIHELIKKNKGRLTMYEMEVFVTDTLNNMRRVKHINWINITDNPENQRYNYRIDFSITPLPDEDLTNNTSDEELEATFYI